MVGDVQLRQILFACRFPHKGQRAGFVPFSAVCVARRLASLEGVSDSKAMRRLWGLAAEWGGEVVEDEVLWLPTDRFGRLWSGS